jgi:hypothetical protein
LRRHNATRHLCAATYLDDAYRNEIMRKILAQRRRWAAPSYGYDLVAVLRHARRAWWLSTGSALIITGGTAAAALAVPAPTLLCLTALAVWWLVQLRLRVTGDFWRSLIKRNPPEFYQQLTYRRRQANAGILIMLVLAFVGYGVAISRVPDSEVDPRVLADLKTAGLLLLALAAVAVATAIIRAVMVAGLSHMSPQRLPSMRLAHLDAEQHHTVTVYSGPIPFVGSGHPLSTWSFAQRLIRPPKRDLASELTGGGTAPGADQVDPSHAAHEPRLRERHREFDRLPFRAADLIRHLEQRLRALRDEPDPELRLPGLKVRHRVFVPGTESEWIPEYNDGKVVARAIANPGLPLRHYLACEISSWGGEIYTTVHMHVSLQGRSLFLEFSTHVLPPTKAEYHVFDEDGTVGVKFAVRSVAGALWRLPASFGAAVAGIVGGLRYAGSMLVGASSRERARERGLDVGAEVSARELGSDMTTHDWFQYRDVMKHWKIIERRMLSTVLDFLEDRGVDVTEYRQRAIAVLNRGVINVGSGSVQVSGAVGDNNVVETDAATASV